MDENEPQTIEVNGKLLKCLVCSNDLFFSRTMQLDSNIATYFRLVESNGSATCVICSECTYIHWFLG
jgi:hypothetical protein